MRSSGSVTSSSATASNNLYPVAGDALPCPFAFPGRAVAAGTAGRQDRRRTAYRHRRDDPSQQKVDIPLPFQNSAGGAVTTEAGHVVSSTAATCGYQSVGGVLTAPPAPTEGDGPDCVQAFIAIDSGANTLLEFSGGPGQPSSRSVTRSG